jgi:hypothetical protein
MAGVLKNLANATSSRLSLPTANWIEVSNNATELAGKSLTGITVLYSITISYHVRARDGYQIKLEIENASNQFDVHEYDQSKVATICSNINMVDSPYAIAALRLSSCNSCGVTILASGDSSGTWIHNYGHLKKRTVDVCGSKKPLMVQQNTYWIPNPELFPLFAVVFWYPGDKGQISTGACHPGSETLKKESSGKIDEYKDDQNETINVYRISYTYTCSSLDFKPVVSFGCNKDSEHHPIRTEILEQSSSFQTVDLYAWDSSSFASPGGALTSFSSIDQLIPVKDFKIIKQTVTSDSENKKRFKLTADITCDKKLVLYGTHFCKSGESASNYFNKGVIELVRDTFNSEDYTFRVTIEDAPVLLLYASVPMSTTVKEIPIEGDTKPCNSTYGCQVWSSITTTGTSDGDPIIGYYITTSSSTSADTVTLVDMSSGSFTFPSSDEISSNSECFSGDLKDLAHAYFIKPTYFSLSRNNIPMCSTFILGALPEDRAASNLWYLNLYIPSFKLSGDAQAISVQHEDKFSGYDCSGEIASNCNGRVTTSCSYTASFSAYTSNVDLETVGPYSSIPSPLVSASVFPGALFLGAVTAK